jgi:hypothetical protein
MRAETRPNRLWHAACKRRCAMDTKHRSSPKRPRAEVILSLLLCAGIIGALLVPAKAQFASSLPTESSIFTLVEGDYMSPLFSSPATIHVLNSVANDVAQFAGFDDFSGRVEVHDTKQVVNITRFSGSLLSILDLEFLLRERTNRHGSEMYISESFWIAHFAGRADVLGSEIVVHEMRYRIAGVIRSFEGLLSKTDLWISVNSRSPLARLNSMKILGALNDISDWNVAQAKLADAFKQPIIDQVYMEAKGAKLLPMTRGINFMEGPGVAAHRVPPKRWALVGS